MCCVDGARVERTIHPYRRRTGIVTPPAEPVTNEAYAPRGKQRDALHQRSFDAPNDHCTRAVIARCVERSCWRVRRDILERVARHGVSRPRRSQR
jgi:hypothetical protein